MELGAFSVSLSVKDIEASKLFYENLGFAVFAEINRKWLIMKNGDHAIGLFACSIRTFSRAGWVRCSATQRIHRRAKVAAPTQRSWLKHDYGSRRNLYWPG